MSACRLSIELDDPRAVFLAEQPITGKVRVQVDEDVVFRALTVKMVWRTHGGGNEEHGEGPASSRETLAHGAWKAGECHEFPFAIMAPAGPASYHGRYVNLDWELVATVDLPVAVDAEQSVPVTVVGSPSQRDHDFGPTHTPPPEHFVASGGDGTTTMVGLVLLFLALVLAALGATAGHSTSVFLFLAGVAGLLGLGFLAHGMGTHRAARRLGTPLLRIRPMPIRPGEPAKLELAVRASRPLTVTRVSVALTGREWARWTLADKVRYRQHQFHQQELVLAGRDGPSGQYERLDAGEQRVWTGEILLPAGVPGTFSGYHNKVEWEAEVRVAMHHSSDWVETFPVTVAPPPGIVASID